MSIKPKIKVIAPKQLLDPARLERAVNNALDGAAEGAREDFRVTTQTWNAQPIFKIEKQPGKRLIYTTDPVYRYLDRGTRVRRAVMSKGFRPKSRPGYIGSNKGRGGVVFISRKLSLPGIKARRFASTIAKKWNKQMPKIVQRAIDAEVG